MHHHHVCAFRRNDAARQFQLTRSVLHQNAQLRHASRTQQAFFNDARDHRHVDVAARNDRHNLAAHVKFMVHDGGDRSRARALSDHLAPLHQEQNRLRNFVVIDRHDLIHIPAAKLERQFSRLLDRNAVRNGLRRVQRNDMSRIHGRLHARRTGCLHADNLHIRMQHFDRRRNAGSQSAAANRHDNSVYIRQIIHDFQTDRSLSRDDHRVVKRMDKRRAGFLLNAACLGIRIVIYAAVKHDVRAQLARRLHLGKRCARRHNDGRRHAERPRRQRNALRMVARRGRDDAAGAFFLGQAGDFDICAAHLEGARVLQVFRFQIDLAVFIGQCLELHQTRALCDALEPLPRLQNHAKRKRHTLSLFFLQTNQARLRCFPSLCLKPCVLGFPAYSCVVFQPFSPLDWRSISSTTIS